MRGEAILLLWTPGPGAGAALSGASDHVARELARVRMSRAAEGLEDWRAARIADLEGCLEAALAWEDMILEGAPRRDRAGEPGGGQ